MTTRHVHPLERHSKQPTVRSATIRKSGRDGTSWTPTEKVKRNKLLRQFMNLESGAYTGSPALIAGLEATFGERWERKRSGLCPGCGLKSGHADGCDELVPRPYKITHHGRVVPQIILGESEGGDPWADK